MSKFYICSTYDVYDTASGFYVSKVDCIQWDEDILGPYDGPKYATQEECYHNSICSRVGPQMAAIRPTNNWCNISISSFDIIEKTSSSVTLEVTLPEAYEDTYFEYLLTDSNFEPIVSDYERVVGLGTSLSTTNTLTIQTNNACGMMLRLVKPCPGSGSEISGSESGSGSGGGENNNGNDLQTETRFIFDLSSWSELLSPMKTYIDAGAENWNNLIQYNQSVYDIYKDSNPNWNGLALVNYVEFNDPSAGYVAACGPVASIDIIDNDTNNIKINSVTFQLFVNMYYYNNPTYNFSDADWIGVMTHELGHALGIGTHWNTVFDYWLDGNIYESSVQAYNSIIGDSTNSRDKVPLEDNGGPGTVAAHWEWNFRPGSYDNANGVTYPGLAAYDVMIAGLTVGSPRPISILSTQFLTDIGYEMRTQPLSAPVGQFTNLITNNNQNHIYLHHACGTSSVCGCHTRHKVGTVDLTNNVLFIH